MHKLFYLLIFLALTMVACQKDVTIEIPGPTDPTLFIESILYPNEFAKVFVSNSLPFFNAKVSPQQIFARDAKVYLVQGLEEEQLSQDSIFDRFRCRWQPYFSSRRRIEYGETYSLRVEWEELAFFASTTIDQPKVNISDVTYNPDFYDIYGGHDGVVLKIADVPGVANNYRFQMDRTIDNTRSHAHILDVLINDCTRPGELFQVTDLGRTIYGDANIDGEDLQMFVEVSFEYLKGDEATIFVQSLDQASAAFYRDLDNQLQSILNPFIEPVFIKSTIEGTLGVFGSAVRSDPFHFVYPQDNP